MRANVLSCLQLVGRWSFKIGVGTAAGGVFAQLMPELLGKARRPFIGLSEK